MSNNKLSKIIIWAGIFAVSFGLGFVGVQLINKDKPSITEAPSGNMGSPTPTSSSTSSPISSSSTPTEDLDALAQSQEPEQSNEKIIEEVNNENILEGTNSKDKTPTQTQVVEEPKVTLSATKPKLNGDNYSFVATANNLPKDELFFYELWNSNGTLVKSSDNGAFSNVPGVAGGKYTLWLVGSKSRKLVSINVRGFNLINKVQESSPSTTESNLEKTKEEKLTEKPKEEKPKEEKPKEEKPKEEKPKKMLITKEEFQTKLLNANDQTLKMARKATDKKSVLANTFSLVVVDMKADERNHPSDVEGVREKIHFDIWKSATVIDVTYDEATGQVTKAVIRPVY